MLSQLCISCLSVSLCLSSSFGPLGVHQNVLLKDRVVIATGTLIKLNRSAAMRQYDVIVFGDALLYATSSNPNNPKATLKVHRVIQLACTTLVDLPDSNGESVL
jgi:hypothetical protein